MLDRLKLKPIIFSEDDGKDYLVIEIYINDEIYTNFRAVAVDLSEFKKSLKADGEYFILTCWCGWQECAGIYHPFKVTRDYKCVYWKDLDKPKRPTYSFTLENYRRAYSTMLEKTNWLLAQRNERPIEIVPDGNSEFLELPGPASLELKEEDKIKKARKKKSGKGSGRKKR